MNKVVQIGGDRIGKRYWIKDNKRIFENPNGYQKSTLSESVSSSDTSSDTSSDASSDASSDTDTTSYSDNNSSPSSDSSPSSYYDTISDYSPLVLKNRVPYKRDPINYTILNNYKILHTCNDKNCNKYNQVIPMESINEHSQKHIERQQRHKKENFSPIPLTKTKTIR
jgi:hypothetical protein